MTGVETAVRVLVVDDQRLIREGIASLLEIQPGIAVVGTAANGQEAVAQAMALTPDVILMDVRMPVMDGVQATKAIREQRPSCQILMLTTFDDEEYVIKALQAGARGYLLKDIPVDDLAQAVRLTHAGIYQLDPSVAGSLVRLLGEKKVEGVETAVLRADAASVAEGAVPPPSHDLTGRELEVLRLIATGATNREIADQLVVSEGTVKNHVSSILNRLGLRDRVQAALYAQKHQLL
jgi:DNA-binding NarL/FixJ family response regulator